MLILIFIVVFIIAFLISYQVYPKAEKRVQEVHEQKVDKASADLEDMFVFVNKQKLFLLFTVIPLGLAGAAFFITKNIIIVGIAAVLGLFIPTFFIRNYEVQRRRKFNLQLIDALMLLSASLKAGLSLSQAFEEMVEEMPPPISQEFDLVIKELNMGVSFEDALRHLKKRMRSDDLDLIVTAMSIARETGGQLPAVFTKLVYTIKERQTLRGKVGALTIQAKLQGLIMSLLPVIFVVVVHRFNPEHFQFLLNDQLGRLLLGYAVFSQIVGAFLIFKFSQVEV